MSPILITRCTWSQNYSEIHIRLPLKNVEPSKVNLITTEKFLKINFAPYLFQIVFTEKVDPTKTKCILKDYEVVVELRKLVAQMWHSLSLSVNKNELIELKKHIISQKHEEMKHKLQTRLKESQEHRRKVNTFQISVTKGEKDEIQLVKDQAKCVGFRKLTALKYDSKVENQISAQVERLTTHEKRSGSISPYQSIVRIPVPFPRTESVIHFCLSPRILPSPKRPSKRAEEEEWLKKETEAMRPSGFILDDLTDKERNPVWLLNKGMSFFKNGNYQGAMNAFVYGSKISPKMAIFYLRLAQTQLKLKHYGKAIENCNKTLELLLPVVENNTSMRTEAYRTRTAAYAYLNELELKSTAHNSEKY